MKILLSIIIIVLLVVLGWFGYQYQQTQHTVTALHQTLLATEQDGEQVESLRENVRRLKEQLTQQNEEDRIYTILAGGDIMLDRGVEGKIKSLGRNYNFAFDLIRDDLNHADLVFANLEGSISNVGVDTGKAYSFRFEPETAQSLYTAGIDIVSLANNHMLDWGRDSLCDTTKHLAQAGVHFVGAGCTADEAETPYIIELGTTRVAFLAYTEFYQGAHAVGDKPGMTEWNVDKITERITSIKQQPDIDLVMVSMHWGIEYEPRASTSQVTLGQTFIDAGADVVIGHHPHVVEEIERYGDGWIIYSLGNFVFDQSWSTETMRGLVAEIQVQNGRVYDIIPHSIQLNDHYQPYMVDEI
ncbi:CapA family protein [Patescibacteria group bacterium]|nr:CapA family protein [Patescibacteria group bacterium]